MTTESTHARRNPVMHADRAVAVLRELTAATASGYGDPVTLYGTLVRLRNATRLIDQAVDQAAQWLRAADAAGQIGDDGEAGHAPAAATLEALSTAKADAGTLAQSLDAAAGHARHLTGPGPANRPD